MITKKAYVCSIDFQHEIGLANDVVVYASIDALKEKRSCWEECGIVELEIKVNKWIEPQNFYKEEKV